ncbi:hypothetical protein CspeluHIS016_0600060 [Cutaneotrichosporon spelunceum]|uniref:Uncharacterized protein n=1 Tax=Cutaneotrichosporon spelunceum TaxID=1672016 RepID=A0AAD3TXZ7_9TREE|nr:hypothetical protein CspeluHIS016_0600060 [Cutaneotrichosporon spelunceum]
MSNIPPSDHDIARQATALAHNWVLRAPHVTEAWVYLGPLPGTAYMVHGEVLSVSEIPSWLIPGAEERRASFLRRLTSLARLCDSPLVAHCCFGQQGATPQSSKAQSDFGDLLQRLRNDHPEDAAQTEQDDTETSEPAPEPAPEPVPPPEAGPTRNSSFLPIFEPLVNSITDAATEWAAVTVDTVWVCLADINGQPQSTVLFGQDGRVLTPGEAGLNLQELTLITLMEWRDFVSAGPVGTHHPGMVVIWSDGTSSDITRIEWKTVVEADVDEWAVQIKSASACKQLTTLPAGYTLPSPNTQPTAHTLLTRSALPAQPAQPSQPPIPPQPPMRSPRTELSPLPATLQPQPSRGNAAPLPRSSHSPLPSSPHTPRPGSALLRACLPAKFVAGSATAPTRETAFLAAAECHLGSILHALLAWPLNRRAVSTMWVYLRHFKDTSAVWVLMDDGLGSSVAALGGRDPAPFFHAIGDDWEGVCRSREPHPREVVLIVRPNAGPSLTMETSWEHDELNWPKVPPGEVRDVLPNWEPRTS